MIYSLNLTTKYSVAAHADWIDGDDIIVATTVSTADTVIKFTKEINIVKPYLIYTLQLYAD